MLMVGGETPINSGIELAARLLAEVPDLYEQLKAKVWIAFIRLLTCAGITICLPIHLAG